MRGIVMKVSWLRTVTHPHSSFRGVADAKSLGSFSIFQNDLNFFTSFFACLPACCYLSASSNSIYNIINIVASACGVFALLVLIRCQCHLSLTGKDTKLYHGEKYLVSEAMINSFTWQMNLTVRNLHKSDFASYVCSSENALGKSDTRIRLQGKKKEM